MRLGFDAKRVFHNATGLGNYGRDLVRALCAEAPEHAYLLYSPRPGPLPFDAGGARVEVRGPSGLGRLLPALWRQAGVARDLRRDRVELFHGLTGELPLGIERVGVAPVVTIHDLIFERYPELYAAVDRRIYRWKARSATARARRVIAISEQTRRDLVDLYRVPEERIRVVYQDCHPAFRAEVGPERLAEAARRHGLEPGFVLAVGTIEPRKNLLTVAKALAELPDVRLVVVGRPTPYAGVVEAFLRERGIEGRVRFLRGVSTEDLAALYRLAAVAVYPSLFEGFGIPIVEALASGTPVVTTRGGVFPEAGGPGSAYVAPGDAGELRAALAEILGSPDRRAAMRAAGLAHAERFRSERIAADVLAVYAEALG
ncbi:MAG TPA: glycosyltransferase family 1 protein [Anaeromyxobacter sp.]|nr:glycosyltransferase family 1 protein [Anaeromyxobacter sp.]